MKTLTTSIMSAALAVFVSSAFAADEAKDKMVTLDGTATCAKCDLEVADECASVLQVKEGDQTVTYYLTGKADKDFHKKICKLAKPVKMTGTVSEKDGKKMLDVTEIEMKEK